MDLAGRAIGESARSMSRRIDFYLYILKFAGVLGSLRQMNILYSLMSYAASPKAKAHQLSHF